jgi:hypothetical protein
MNNKSLLNLVRAMALVFGLFLLTGAVFYPGGGTITTVTTIISSNSYTTNLYSTNIYSSVIYSSNVFITNLYATNAYITNIYSSNAFITNLYATNAYITNLYADTTIITNLTVQNNTTVKGNAIINNIIATNIISTGGISIGTGADPGAGNLSATNVIMAGTYANITNLTTFYPTINSLKGRVFVSTNADFTLSFDVLPATLSTNGVQGLVIFTNSAVATKIITISGVNNQASVTFGMTNGQYTYLAWDRQKEFTNVWAWDSYRTILK